MYLLSILIPLLVVGYGPGCESDQHSIGGVDFDSYCIEIGEGETTVELSDVNGDRNLDLLVAVQDEGTITVFLGDGSGRLRRGSSIPAGSNPTDLEVADINADGHLDIVVANHETTNLTLLIGNGRGDFRPAQNSPLRVDVLPHPHVAAVHDFDRDGLFDLLVDDRTRNGIRIMRGRGNGSFDSDGLLIDVGGDPYLGFAIGDVDGDGMSDIVAPIENRIGLSFGSTSIESSSEPSFVQMENPFAVGLADFNGDLALDIVAVSERRSPGVRLFLGDGAGEFTESVDSPYSISSGAKKMDVGDVNGDGVADAVVSSWSGSASVLLGGTDLRTIVQIQESGNPWGVAVGDLNGDGRDDFAVADGVESEVRIFVSK